ncbi:MAG: hypothetical protein RBG13Loki_0009 [Promethearchaeota archaeon CR_4]|nr:MAG: hypothetical protein RBG13Loki_0009 [Candidatus Lokiarchaeota archaeon CR_4]
MSNDGKLRFKHSKIMLRDKKGKFSTPTFSLPIEQAVLKPCGGAKDHRPLAILTDHRRDHKYRRVLFSAIVNFREFTKGRRQGRGLINRKKFNKEIYAKRIIRYPPDDLRNPPVN